MFDPPATINNLEKEDYQEGPLREVCILPFPLTDALLQGETKELCLYEERFHQLFETATNDHGGVVAMGLLAPPAGIIQTMPLCEVESFQTMKGDTGFGTSYSILATIRAVGRASLVYVEEEKDGSEFLRGWCTEMCDDVSSENVRSNYNAKSILQKANEIANRLEEVLDSIVQIETQLEQLGMESGDEDTGTSDAAIRRRLLEAELEAELGHDDDEEEDDDDYIDEDDEMDIENSRKRLMKAFQVAKASDVQGYRITSSKSDPEDMRTIQDLSALSWAYFASEGNTDDILSYRLSSLEVVDLCERLKLALVMMMERKSVLKETLRSTKDSNED